MLQLPILAGTLLKVVHKNQSRMMDQRSVGIHVRDDSVSLGWNFLHAKSMKLMVGVWL